MNDQPTSDALSRASAYLDGELDAAEIDAAEADPAVMSEAAQLRSLREAIREVGEPTSYARDTAIAAALAEYDRRRHPVPVVRSQPRPAYTRWLAVAAAVTGLAALGAVITTNARGGGDDDAAGVEATQVAAAGSDAGLASRTAPAGGAPEAPAAESAQSAASLASEQTGAPATTTSTAQADAVLSASATTAASEAGAPPPFDPDSPIPNEFELGRVGRQLLAEFVAGSRASLTGAPCDGSIPGVVLLSHAVLIVDDVARPVLVAADRNNDDTFALDPDTCVIVATGK
jgi:hypothetical protein